MSDGKISEKIDVVDNKSICARVKDPLAAICVSYEGDRFIFE